MKYTFALLTIALTMNFASAASAREGDFYGKWVGISTIDIFESGAPILKKSKMSYQATIYFTENRISVTGSAEIRQKFYNCYNPIFEPRMWSSIGYSRLGEYDIRAIFGFWRIKYDYNINRVYRLKCRNGDQVNFDYKYGIDEDGPKEAPLGKVPFDEVNLVYVSNRLMVMHFYDEWILFRKRN